MNKLMKKILLFMVGVITVFMLGTGDCFAAQEYTEIPAENETPDEGNVFLGVPGEFDTHVQDTIKLINKYRKEACDKGYEDPRNYKRKLKSSDYVPIKWSRDLEYIARIRAAECNISYEHSRPNGKDWFKITTENGVHSFAENLANECQPLMKDGIKRYYDMEKNVYIGKEKGFVTGHYEALINPDNIYIGVAHMYNEFCRSSMNVCEFMSKENVESLESQLGQTLIIDTTPLSNPGKVICKVEAKKKYVSEPEIYDIDETELSIKDYWSTRVLVRCSYNDGMYGGMGCYMGNVKWTCSSKYLKITDNGTIIPKKYTKARNIKFNYSGDLNGSIYYYKAVVPEVGQIVKAKASKGKFYVKFKKKSTADGYRVRLIRGNFVSGHEKSYKEMKLSKKKSSYTFKNLPKGWYWVFVEPYKKVNGKKIYNTTMRTNNKSRYVK